MVATSHAYGAITFYNSQSSFNTAIPTTLLEDFTSATPDVNLTSLTLHGVTYTPLAGSPVNNVVVAKPPYNNFGAGVGDTTSYILTASGNEDFTANFSIPYHAVGFDTYLNGLGPATVQVYSGANLLGTFTYNANVDDKEYLGFMSSDPITSFRWTGTLGGQLNTGIGNISVSAVPEPSTYLAGITALGILGLFGWRNRK